MTTDPRWSTVRGIVVEGYRVASGISEHSPVPGGTIARQVPFFKERGLDLSQFHYATLNVDISPRRAVLTRAGYTFRWVDWLPGHRPEDFSFSRCGLTFEGREYEAFVYYPHPETKLAHPHPPSLVEVMARFVEGIRYGAAVELRLNTEEIRLFTGPATDPAA